MGLFGKGPSEAINTLWTGNPSGESPAADKLPAVSEIVKPVNPVQNVIDATAPATVNTGAVTDTKSSWPDWISAGSSLLGGVGSVVGGLLSWSEQKKANKIAQKQFAENLAFQKDQFYNAIQHRVVDALKAGVHPLAALGISAHGSASPTAHVQSATGLGNAVASLSSVVNSYFENALKHRHLDMLDSQIGANKALAIKYSADAGRQLAETAYTNKELNNYHLYRTWDRINNSLNVVTGGVRAGAMWKGMSRDINRYYGDVYINR